MVAQGPDNATRIAMQAELREIAGAPGEHLIDPFAGLASGDMLAPRNANGSHPPPDMSWLPKWAVRGSAVLKAPPLPPAVWGQGSEVLWAMGEALMIAGPPGTSKTTLAANLIAGLLGADAEVLGLPVRPLPPGKRVLALLMDRPRQAASRLRSVLAGRLSARELDERLVLVAGPPPADFVKDPDALARMAAKASAGAVIADSLKDAVIGLSDEKAAQGWNRAVQTALKQRVEVCVLHHVRKQQVGNKKPDKHDDIYGNVLGMAGMGSIIMLSGEPGTPVVDFSHVKQPAERPARAGSR